jgi:putative ABC transport system ATP-binding protein
MLELQGVIKHYPVGEESIRAVDGVSLHVRQCELVMLYGPSGSGKTTLLKLIAGALQPDSGHVLVEGRDVHALSRKELDHYRLRQLGIIGQPGDLISGARAIDNASLKLWMVGSNGESSTRLESLLERLGLRERMRHRTEQLSMGERQRVMIAQALATDPALVLADEPTATLDTQRTGEVLDLLRNLCRERGTAVLLVTHDPQAASFADRVYELHDGRLRDYQTPGQSV